MEREIKGTVFKFGDNINTDIISPPQYIELTVEEASVHAMEAVDPTFTQRFQPGDIIVGGNNFGSGSSRETFPLALRYLGAGAVVAKFFARIFYRNAINIGLPIMECREAAEKIQEGDQIFVDFKQGLIKNESRNEVYTANPFPPFIEDIIEKGGLLASIKAKAKTE